MKSIQQRDTVICHTAWLSSFSESLLSSLALDLRVWEMNTLLSASFERELLHLCRKRTHVASFWFGLYSEGTWVCPTSFLNSSSSWYLACHTEILFCQQNPKLFKTWIRSAVILDLAGFDWKSWYWQRCRFAHLQEIMRNQCISVLKWQVNPTIHLTYFASFWFGG